MFRFIAICALATIAAAAPGFIEEQHVAVAPVVAKVGAVVHSAPVATSHQSFTQFHNQAVLTPVVKHVVPAVPVIKTVVPSVPVYKTVAPVVPVVKHVAPVYPVVPVVKHVAPIVPVVKHVAPVVPVIKSVPVVQHQTYVAAPAVHHVAPVSVVKALPHAVSHQSHTQVHHQKTFITPVVASVPVVKTVAVAAAPLAHVYHH
uniref:Calphotin n=1 Tax=Drosophila rhopaloa TaxID=1041015 RepID=A0A6P4DTM2_DRORH